MVDKQLPTMRICITTQSLQLPLNRRAMMVLSPLYFPTEAAGLAGRLETDKALAMMAVDSPVVVTCRFWRPLRGSWPGSPLGCARATGSMVTTLSTVRIRPTANGRETKVPGAVSCRHHWVFGSYCGRKYWKASFGGHWRQF
jgi:hypothetical protein